MSGGGLVALLATAGAGYALYRWGGLGLSQAEQQPEYIMVSQPAPASSERSGFQKLADGLGLVSELAGAWGIDLGGSSGSSGSSAGWPEYSAGGDSLPEIINAFIPWGEMTGQAAGYTGGASGSYAGLLNVIGRAEGGAAGYDAISGLVARSRYPARPVSQMTVGQVLDWQRSIDAYQNSEAVGRYQIMEDTLRGLVSRGVANRAEQFSSGVQDRLAVELMRGRGLDRYLSGSISAEQFANNLAREWAGLPVVTGASAGRSYYDGYNTNSATVSVAEYMAAIRALRPTYA